MKAPGPLPSTRQVAWRLEPVSGSSPPLRWSLGQTGGGDGSRPNRTLDVQMWKIKKSICPCSMQVQLDDLASDLFLSYESLSLPGSVEYQKLSPRFSRQKNTRGRTPEDLGPSRYWSCVFISKSESASQWLSENALVWVSTHDWRHGA